MFFWDKYFSIRFFFSHHIAFIPPAICIALIPTVGCNQIVSCILLILAVTFNGASFSGFNSTHVDMAPDFAGVLMGFTNSFGNVPGFVVPKVVNLFTNKEVSHFSFFVCFVSFTTILLIYIYFFLYINK